MANVPANILQAARESAEIPQDCLTCGARLARGRGIYIPEDPDPATPAFIVYPICKECIGTLNIQKVVHARLRGEDMDIEDLYD